MKRDIIHINEELCDGCGLCIPNCHEGALQLIDGKARLISDLMCDGLGACIGHCPQGAITIESREADAYNETEVIRQMAVKGKNTVIAHLQHLLDHDETGFAEEGINWLLENKKSLDFDPVQAIAMARGEEQIQEPVKIGAMATTSPAAGCGCAGSAPKEIKPAFAMASPKLQDQPSELRQWPVQFHLINPGASYFRGADILLAADCSAYTIGNFHSKFLKGKSLIIACPKLDTGLDSYLQKLVQLIDNSMINTIHVLVMEVPCCGGLIRLVQQATGIAGRKVPVKATVISVNGEVLSEDWL